MAPSTRPPRFSGPQHRGAMTALRAAKRADAAARGKLTRPEDRRAWRLAHQADGGPVLTAQALAWRQPWKDAYENRGLATAALRCMPKHRKSQGLRPYYCPAGHWHLGRDLRRSELTWKAVA